MSSAPHLYDVSTRTDLVDWGVQPAALEGQSRSSGRLVHKGPDNRPDELCHSVAGRATYTSDEGEVIEVSAGTVVMFPKGWSGECAVHEEMRNVYALF